MTSQIAQKSINRKPITAMLDMLAAAIVIYFAISLGVMQVRNASVQAVEHVSAASASILI